ncbi:glycosyltransferase family 61 protein [Paracoccus sp. Z118]|uniref:glycosyltransferase 61 family protein n=1 Tax=Paracoccus sp. Z118 TaxID=2851017 RepID=UPI001C2BE0B7|nr:glycosyltransferase 61 family protein [Paracoccus sp. Z118]MBV0891358.1 glycosyltransferase family 61 protein [Paracoccus sp. Z118]
MPLILDNTDFDIVMVENGLVVPRFDDDEGRQQRSGVLTADGIFVENSISWHTADFAVNSVPETPEADQVQELSGTWIFGGIAYGHFGHFLLESLSRMWALSQIEGEVDGIVFTPKFRRLNTAKVMKGFSPLMGALGIAVPTRSTTVPLRVERLYVPRQGIGMGGLSLGTAKFREHVRQNAGKYIEAKGAQRIYISRSKLPPMRGGLIGESILEELLAAEGYEMFHPQRHPAEEQIAQYKAAKDIIAVDCSPLHLVAYVGNHEQRVAILTRRSMAVAASMADQIATFTSADAFEVNTLVRDWVPRNANRAGRSSFGEIDFPRTYEMLKAKGMVDSETPWPALTKEQRQADLARIAETHKIEFRALNDTAPQDLAAEFDATIPTSS